MFSSVFLCIADSKAPIETKSFKCREFEDFLEADLYFRNKLCNNTETIENKSIGLHTMVSIPKVLPNFIKKTVLHYKISKIFVNTDITN